MLVFIWIEINTIRCMEVVFKYLLLQLYGCSYTFEHFKNVFVSTLTICCKKWTWVFKIQTTNWLLKL